MNFVDSIYQETKNIQTAIMTHPFTKGIGDGTLNKDSFKFFIEQDYLFLIEYSKILALATAKSPDYKTMSSFSKLLEETLNNEIENRPSWRRISAVRENKIFYIDEHLSLIHI